MVFFFRHLYRDFNYLKQYLHEKLPFLSSESAVDDLCLGRDDVIFARSCKTYLKCVNGTAVTFHCDQYMVFNMNSGNCE